MLERLEKFKEFEKKIKLQAAIILAKKMTTIRTNDEGADETTKNILISEVQEAQKKKEEIIGNQVKERSALEEELVKLNLDDRIETILILHYLQGMTLKDVSIHLGLSYDYTRELCMNGRKLLE